MMTTMLSFTANNMSKSTKIKELPRFIKNLTLSLSSSSNSSLTSILHQVQQGAITASQAEKEITVLQQQQRGNNDGLESFANIDYNRSKRTGFPEAIFSPGKTPHQIGSILDSMASRVKSNNEDDARPMPILATRIDPELHGQIEKFPFQHGSITYHANARIVSMQPFSTSSTSPITHGNDKNTPKKKIIVACAGTTDLPVAEEAAVTLELSTTPQHSNIEIHRLYDVGVAGLHRILNALPALCDPSTSCIIVCAGMDGALPSVVAGLVSVPVIAVPTSVGYGASFQGVGALLTMLNSCAPGVCVVNIDNGFGAAALAYKFLRSSS